MNYYAHGGLANAAQHLAQKGRNGDTQLIHVSPKELHGLQALAAANGTSLTINPHTGLPEAFNFKKLIPMVAGAALTATGIGAPAAALMVGGAYAAGTGSIQKGLMAGIGAYGGAGLGAGLAEAGASSLAESSAIAPTPAFQEVAGNQLIPTEQGNLYLPNGSAQSSVNIGPNVPEEFAPFAQGAPSAVPPPPAAPFGQSVSNVGRGIEGLSTSAGRSAVYSALPTGTLPALGATALDASQKEKSSVPGYQEDEYDRRLKGYKLSPNYQAYTAPTPNPYYRPVYAAIGGIMNSNAPHSFDDESGSDNVGMATGGMNMASGGIAGLGGYSDGGRMLKGPGDGMSDSIPGVIGGKQPARLADGEFVVPADVVSHLGNGSTDAGAKKLYSMMDKVRQARTGQKKQAPQVNVDKYLPMGKASGGITGYASGGAVGYADGGEIAAAYEAVLGRAPDAAGAAYWASTGASAADIAKALAASPEAKVYQPTQVQKIFNEQLGRGAEQTAVDFYTKALASGQSAADVAKSIAQAKEGQDMDIQAATSAYRQVMGRNPEPAGLQYWLSVAQSQGLTTQQLKDSIKAAAAPEVAQRGIIKPFDNMQLNSLEADPYAGYYSNQSIYDIAPDAENVSMIGDRKVQFRTPVTQQAVVSNFINGVYTSNAGKDAYAATPGKEILNMPHIQAAIKVARDNGTLNASDFDNLTANLNAAKTPAQIRSALANPQGQVVVDAIYGQQIGEAKTLADAQAEAVGRQAVLTAQDPGYYQSNQVLSNAYKAAGLTVPFNYANYQNVDTRDRTSNLLTPQNFAQKQTDLINTLNRNDPFRTSYQPINRGIANMPNSVQDPYSNEGLQFLYSNMMNQYAPPPADFVNPATFVSNRPYVYRPPAPNNLVLNAPVADASKPATPAADPAVTTRLAPATD